MSDLLADAGGLREGDEIDGARTFAPPAGEVAIAVDEDVLVIADSETAIEAAIERADAGDGLDEETFEARLGDLSSDAILRASADAQSLFDATGADVAAGIPWVASLDSFGLVADVEADRATMDVLATGSGVGETELPIATGSAGPKLYSDLTSIANADQAQTVSFLANAVRASVPSAAFEEVSGRIADDAGTELPELAAAFGQGVRAETANEETVTRSEVQDREVVAEALRGLHDQVPRLAQLESDGGPAQTAIGLAAALLPALPLAEGYFPEDTKVEPVAGETDLYRMQGPTSEFQEGEEFVFGLIGDLFVSAPSVDKARQIASEEPDAEAELPGSIAGRIQLEQGDLSFEGYDDEGTNVTLSVVDIGIEAAGDTVRLRLQAGL
jgi:hypothetical protein